MPYTDREQQLAYMRIYMQRKRAVDRIARLMKRREGLLQEYEEDPYLKHIVPEEEAASFIVKEIAECLETVRRCEGLLKSQQKRAILGG